MVPVDEIVRIAAVFAHIEWPLISDRIDALVSALGWTRRPHATRIRLSTNLPVNWLFRIESVGVDGDAVGVSGL